MHLGDPQVEEGRQGWGLSIRTVRPWVMGLSDIPVLQIWIPRGWRGGDRALGLRLRAGLSRPADPQVPWPPNTYMACPAQQYGCSALPSTLAYRLQTYSRLRASWALSKPVSLLAQAFLPTPPPGLSSGSPLTTFLSQPGVYVGCPPEGDPVGLPSLPESPSDTPASVSAPSTAVCAAHRN